MERFNALGRGAQMMLVGAVLLLIDLLLHLAGLRPRGLADEPASMRPQRLARHRVPHRDPHDRPARLADRATWPSVNIPLPVSTAMTSALLGTLILIFAIIKLITILGDEATDLGVDRRRPRSRDRRRSLHEIQEAGGVESLKSEASSFGGSGGAATPLRRRRQPPPAATSRPAAAEPPPQAAIRTPATRRRGATPDAAPDAAGDEPSTERER